MKKNQIYRILICCLLVLNSVFGNAQTDQFRVLEGIPHLPVFSSTSDISSPELGMLIFSTTDNLPMIYDGSTWIGLCENSGVISESNKFRVKNKIPFLPVQGTLSVSPSSGSMYLDNSSASVKVYTGTSWKEVPDLNTASFTNKDGFSSLQEMIQLPVLTNDPSPMGLGKGAIYINSTDKRFKFYDGLAWQLITCNYAPVASSVSITIVSVLKEGYDLTGSYSYSDVENEPESGTTVQWYRADDNSGTNLEAIAAAITDTYTMSADDVDKYITYGVTPGASAGTSPGKEAFSPYAGPVVANELPIASNVTFTGTLRNFEELTGSYTYSDTEGDPEDGTTFKWYRADDAGGTNQTEISGYTSPAYVLQSADVDKFVAFAVIPSASSGNSPGNETLSTFQGPVIENYPPTLASATINIVSDLQEGYVLNTTYSGYSDTEGDAEGIPVYQWYRADDNSGTNQLAITDATGSSYTMTSGDLGKYISCGIKPTAVKGNSPGAEVLADYVGPILTNEVPVLASATVNIETSLHEGYLLNATSSGYSDAENDAEGTHIYQWYRADDNTGTSQLAISGATESSYQMMGDDLDKYISCGVKPVAQAGKSPGDEVLAAYVGPVLPNAAPVFASSTVNVETQLKVGYDLTGTGNVYSDAENDAEGTHIYQWYRADDNSGTNQVLLTGETDSTYTMTSDDLDKYISCGIKPVAQAGKSPGDEVLADYVGPVLPNEPPVIANLTLKWAYVDTKTKTYYDYSDAENDPEGVHGYVWEIADDDLGTNASQLGTMESYIPVKADSGRYVRVSMTPKATKGASPGTAVTSNWVFVDEAALVLEFTTASNTSIKLPFTGGTFTNAAISVDGGEMKEVSSYSDADLTFNVNGTVIVALAGDELGLWDGYQGTTEFRNALTEVINWTGLTSYSKTFYSCKYLKAVPESPLPENTYTTDFSQLFYSCRSLKAIPEGLFDNNTELTKVDHTFYYCDSIQSIPQGLFDYNTKITEFYRTFYTCRSIKEIPAGLFDKNTKVREFNETFHSCHSIKEIPAGLFDKNTEVTKFKGTFYSCGSIQMIPIGLFDKNTKVTSFDETFYSCYSIKLIPDHLFDKNINVTSFEETFYSCSITLIPDRLFDKNIKVTGFYGTFRNCTSIQSIPKELFHKNTDVFDFRYTFESLRSIKEIPDSLFHNNEKATHFDYVFGYVANITKIPEILFQKNTKVTSFKGSFSGCSRIKAIPENFFQYNIYVKTFESTFSFCDSLESISSRLFYQNGIVENFNSTFRSCKSLKSLPSNLFYKNSQVKTAKWIFRGCTGLIEVPDHLFGNSGNSLENVKGAFAECTNIRKYFQFLEGKINLVDASECYYLCTSMTGTAHDFWNDYYYQSVKADNCFYRCTGLSNYNFIPYEWKGN